VPEARVLVILREPTDRCWSYFRFEKSRARIPEDMDVESYLDRCEELRIQGVDRLRENRAYHGLTGGCYADWMGEWSAEFGSRLKVLYFDDLSRDARGTVKDICSWLDIDDGPVDRFDMAVENRTQLVRSDLAQRLALAVNRRAEGLFRRHPATKRRLRSLYYAANRAPAELTLSEAAARRMAEFYEPYDRRLAAQLGAMGAPRPPWVAVDR
jgi:hypothetical protein